MVWESVCTSKRCGGLGLRHFSDWNRVLGLKLIWLLFTSVGSHPMNLLLTHQGMIVTFESTTTDSFSTFEMWNYLYNQASLVEWHDAV